MQFFLVLLALIGLAIYFCAKNSDVIKELPFFKTRKDALKDAAYYAAEKAAAPKPKTLDPYSQTLSAAELSQAYENLVPSNMTSSRISNGLRQTDAVARKVTALDQALDRKFIRGSLTFDKHIAAVNIVEKQVLSNLAVQYNKLALFDADKYSTLQEAKRIGQMPPGDRPSLLDVIFGRNSQGQSNVEVEDVKRKLREYGIDPDVMVATAKRSSNPFIAAIMSVIGSSTARGGKRRIAENSGEIDAAIEEMDRELRDADFIISENEKLLLQLDKLASELTSLDMKDVKQGSSEAMDEINEVIGNMGYYE